MTILGEIVGCEQNFERLGQTTIVQHDIISRLTGFLLKYWVCSTVLEIELAQWQRHHAKNSYIEPKVL